MLQAHRQALFYHSMLLLGGKHFFIVKGPFAWTIVEKIYLTVDAYFGVRKCRNFFFNLKFFEGREENLSAPVEFLN